MQEMYVALSGAVASERRLSVIANNLANAATPGFRADHCAVQGFGANPDYDRMNASTHEDLKVEAPAESFYDSLYATLCNQKTDFTAGPARETGSRTDVMIEGDGFFVVNTPAGERFTRCGAFQVDADGVLRTAAEGYEVADDRGRAIEIPTPQFSVQPDGSVLDRDNQEVARLGLVKFENNDLLTKEGANLFSLTAGADRPEQADHDVVTVQQGWLEGSNVNTVDSLVGMIQLERAYQAQMKAIHTADSSTGALLKDFQ